MRRPLMVMGALLVALVAAAVALWGGDDAREASSPDTSPSTGASATAPSAPPTTSASTTTVVPPSSFCDPTAWPDGAVPGPSDEAVIDGPVLLDCDAAVGALRIAASGSLTWVGDAELVVDAARSTGRVEVMGRLTMRPEPGTRHVLTFTGIDASQMVGGDDGMMSDPGGLHAMGSGVLDLDGPDRTAWTRLAEPAAAGDRELVVDDASGWRSGDEITLTPALPPDHPEASTAYQDAVIEAVRGDVVELDRALTHDAAGVDGLLPEVLNLTRDVVIRTGDGDPGYVTFHPTSGVQQLADVAFVGLGPEDVQGRYPVHLHQLGEASRGSTFDRLLVLDSSNRAIVPHGSHGTVWTDVVAHRVSGDAFWWDRGDEPHASHDTVWHRAVASAVTEAEGARFRLAGFELGSGDGNVITESVAVGIQGRADSSGFEWPEVQTRGTGVWTFEGNVAHNNARHGAFVWQNGPLEHVVTDFVAWHNGSFGVSHGAYRNAYHWQELELVHNGGGGILLHALSRDAGLRFTDVEVRGGPTGVRTTTHNQPLIQPTTFDGLVVTDVDVPLSGGAHVHPDSIDVHRYDGPPVVFDEDAHRDSEWRIHDGDEVKAFRP
ncbi:MAG: hypothetical protein AAGD18_00380 [Actinomycetota bacterium]